MSHQITKKIREVVEGVVINNYFLSYEEFKEFLEKALNNNPGNPLNLWRKFLKLEVDNLINNYEALIATAPMRAYTLWENITIKYFNNTPVSILAATNLDISETTEIYANKVESAVLTKNSQNKLQVNRNELSNSIEGNITADVATTMFQNHYQSMARSIIHGKPNNDEINRAIASNQLSDKQKRRLLRALHVHHLKRYYFYKQVFGQINYGKIFEAYIHHLAHWHRWHLTIGQLNSISRLDPRSEEYPDFLTLLYNANNNYSFTRGGDIIITDNTRKVITNVQIKGDKGSDVLFGNGISPNTTKTKFLIPLREILNSQHLSDDVIKELFNKLKNEAWVEKNAADIAQKINMDQFLREVGDNFTKNRYNLVQREDFLVKYK